MTVKTAIILARVSTPGQAEEELPIDSQVDVCTTKAAQLGATVLKVFLEPGVSGRKDRRKVFEQAIAYCKAMRVSYFILWKTDRFARHRARAAWEKYQLRQQGTEMIYVSQDIDTRKKGGRLLEGLYELMDEERSHDISEDTRRSMMKNAREGHWNGGRAPLGYEAVADGKRRKLAVVPTEADIVRKVFELYAAGNGMKSIAMQLNATGFRHRGRLFSKGNVALLLRNHAYTGRVIFNRRDNASGATRPESEWIVTRSHEPIIDDGEFALVQKILVQRAPLETRGATRSLFIFTGLLRCGRCGQGLQTESARGRSRIYHYYNCRGAQKGMGCRPRRLSAPALDTWLKRAIFDKLFTPEVIIESARKLDAQWEDRASEMQRQRRVLLAQRSDAERRRRNIYEVVELQGRGAPALRDLAIRLRELTDQITALNTSLDQLAAQAEEDAELGECEPLSDEAWTEVVQETRIELEGLRDPLEIRTAIGAYVDHIVIKADGAKVCYRPEALIGAVHRQNSWLPEVFCPRTTAVIELAMPLRLAA